MQAKLKLMKKILIREKIYAKELFKELKIRIEENKKEEKENNIQINQSN